MLFKTTIWSQINDARRRGGAALDEIARRYWEPIRQYVLLRGLVDVAEDIAQEVMMQVCDAEFLRDADASKGRFRTLLYRVTNNTISKHLRACNALKRSAPQGTSGAPSMSDGLDAEYNRIWAVHVMREALDCLKGTNPRQAEAIQLHYYDDHPIKVIATRWNTNEQVVKNHLHEGRKRLREIIRERIRAYCSSPGEYRDEWDELSRYVP